MDNSGEFEMALLLICFGSSSWNRDLDLRDVSFSPPPFNGAIHFMHSTTR